MLTLSTKTRYATRILAFLASKPPDESVSARIISKTENISGDYIEQILLRLKVASLVKSVRGPSGGFALARAPENISVAEVIAAMEGELNIIPCLSEYCEREERCPTKTVWRQANDAILKVFSEATIADLAITKSENKNQASNYQI